MLEWARHTLSAQKSSISLEIKHTDLVISSNFTHHLRFISYTNPTMNAQSQNTKSQLTQVDQPKPKVSITLRCPQRLSIFRNKYM